LSTSEELQTIQSSLAKRVTEEVFNQQTKKIKNDSRDYTARQFDELKGVVNEQSAEL